MNADYEAQRLRIEASEKAADDRLAQLKAQLAADKAKREAPLLAELNALNGYQSARWGMSIAKVRALFPHSARSESKVVVKTSVVGFPATVIFFFAQNKLKSTLVAFEHTNKVGSTDELFDTLAKALAGKYGTAETRSPGLGSALRWSGEKTEIDLRNSAAAANLGSAAEIEYDSVKFGDLLQDVSAKAKTDL